MLSFGLIAQMPITSKAGTLPYLIAVNSNPRTNDGTLRARLEASFNPVYLLLLGTGGLHPVARHLQQRLADCWIVRHASKSDTVTGILFHFFAVAMVVLPSKPSGGNRMKLSPAEFHGNNCGSRG
jgi:hypothetical protein